MVKDSEKYKTKTITRKYEWVGDAAAVLGIISLLPVAWAATTTGNVHNLDYTWLSISLASTILWFLFGYTNKIHPTTISAISIGVIIIYLILLKMHIMHRRRFAHSSI